MNEIKKQSENKKLRRGNPAWYRGMPSANPQGRPRGQTTLQAYQGERHIRFGRWEKFCWGLVEPPFTGAAAARKARYSPKSARFIASRLKRNPVVRYVLKEHRAMVELYGFTKNMEYSTTGDVVEKWQQLEKRIQEIRLQNGPEKNIDKSQHF